MAPLDLAAAWQLLVAVLQLGAAVVLVYLLSLAISTIALILGAFTVTPLCQLVWQTVATAVRGAKRWVVGSPPLPPSLRLLAEIDWEYAQAERRIDAIAYAFDRQVAQIIAHGRSPHDARDQRQDPARPVHR